MRTLMASSVRRRGRPGAAPGCHLAPIHWYWPHSSSRQRCHGRHATPHSSCACPFSLPRSLATPTAAASSPLPLRASRAPRALTFASRLFFERLRVCLKLRGEPHFLGLLSSGSRPSRPRLWRTSPDATRCLDLHDVGWTPITSWRTAG